MLTILIRSPLKGAGDLLRHVVTTVSTLASSQEIILRVNIQLVPLTKCAAEDLDLVPGHGTVAARCSSEEDGSNAENKLDCIWQIKYLLLDLKPNGE